MDQRVSSFLDHGRHFTLSLKWFTDGTGPCSWASDSASTSSELDSAAPALLGQAVPAGVSLVLRVVDWDQQGHSSSSDQRGAAAAAGASLTQFSWWL